MVQERLSHSSAPIFYVRNCDMQETVFDRACKEIVSILASTPNPTSRDVAKVKLDVAKKYALLKIPSNSELLRYASGYEDLIKLLRRKPVRSISGVTVVAVMTKPYPCPQIVPCLYCPGGPRYGTPQSYTGREPAALRAIQYDYDPYKQVKARVEQLERVGHKVDKVELIILGGTFTALPKDYIEWFVKKCLDAFNSKSSSSLEEAKKLAEDASIKVSGIIVETRPDWCREKHVDLMLNLGVTRVEIGVQTIYDHIYSMVRRGHRVSDVVEATRIAKDAGLKITYHMMPGLPGSSRDMDVEMFKEIFENPDFRPDSLKIYPCLIVKGSDLYDLWVKGFYKPYECSELMDLLAEALSYVPPYVRIQRIQRDIPAPLIEAGCRFGNLREYVEAEMEKRKKPCRCIRCREVGHKMLKKGIKPRIEDTVLSRIEYEASRGLEIFLSFEDKVRDILIGYLRLRVPSEYAHREELRGSAIVRELHVYGPMLPVGLKPREEWQHKSLGRRLLFEAERIIREEYCLSKIAVISGLGVKKYYRRLGYSYDGPYMSKKLK
ncbi:MAG: tRNA uridine(34) 5-carboxymethylaminomethyl modification radical SAM/GNAT enzyme Elp3 [Candidatus Bathyarchaeia archaeon]